MKKTDSVSSLVIGTGQIGTAIAKILQCDGVDINDIAPSKSYKFLHICIPYSDRFVDIVKAYQHQYSPDYIIIHSTVPVGTSRLCDAVHSPVRGVHPALEEGIRTFTKYFGGRGAFVCSKLFEDKDIEVICVTEPETTEALKLWDTTQYGTLILQMKEIQEFCQRNLVDFNIVYTHANRTYNEGYMKLGRPEVVRPYLKHTGGKIGGHCILANAQLLKSESAYKLRNYDETC